MRRRRHVKTAMPEIMPTVPPIAPMMLGAFSIREDMNDMARTWTISPAAPSSATLCHYLRPAVTASALKAVECPAAARPSDRVRSPHLRLLTPLACPKADSPRKRPHSGQGITRVIRPESKDEAEPIPRGQLGSPSRIPLSAALTEVWHTGIIIEGRFATWRFLLSQRYHGCQSVMRNIFPPRR